MSVNSKLETKIGSLVLKNPVMVASGTFGYGEEMSELYDISKLGAIVTKGISLKPREGNPMPRVVETASGMLNAIGLANVGIEKFISEKLPFLEKAGATVVVNIFGSTVGDYAEVARRLAEETNVPAVEVNISCPNVKSGGVQFGVDPKAAARVTKAVRKVFPRTVIVKLSPQVSDICAIAKGIALEGADSLSLINTIPAMAIDIKSRTPVLANRIGGLSGPAIKPVALKLVHDVFNAVKIPIIGMGGIMTVGDALEFFLSGACAVQIGTANFVSPMSPLEIIDGLECYVSSENLQNIGELTGALK